VAVARDPEGGPGCAEAIAWDEASAARITAAFEATRLGYARETSTRVLAQIDAFVQTWRSGWAQACPSPVPVACLVAQRSRFTELVEVLGDADTNVVEHAVTATLDLPDPTTCLEADAPGELEDRLARVDALDSAGKYADALALARAAAAGAEDAGAIARAWYRIGSLHHKLADMNAAEDLLSQAAWKAQEAGDDETAAWAMTKLVFLVGSDLARPDDARNWARHAAAAIARAGGLPTAEAERLDNLGYVAYDEGKYGEARRRHEDALALVEPLLGSEHPRVATYLNGIGNVQYVLGEHEEALATYRRSLRIRKEALGPDHPEVADSTGNIANVLYSRGDYAAALEQYEQALALRRRAFGDVHPVVALTLHNLANVHLSRGDYALARAGYEEALATWERVLPEDHPKIAGTLSNLGAALMRVGELGLAQRHLTRALRIVERQHGPDNPHVADVLINLGLVEGGLGEEALALEHHRRAYEVRRTAFGPGHPEVAAALTNVGGSAYALQAYDEAAAYYADAARIRIAAQGPDHVDVATPLTGQGRSLLWGGHPREAIEPLERAVVLLTDTDVEPRRIAQAKFALGVALWRAGRDRGRAETLAREALQIHAANPASAGEAQRVRAWLASR
jgi:tetratricopeptide (TPR) repeat protein